MAGEQQLTPEQQEAEALRAAQEGYDNTARGAQPPATSEPTKPLVAEAQPTEQPLAEQTEPDDEIPGEPALEADPVTPPPKPDPIAALSEQLTALRGQVQELAASGGAAAEVRKLHGDIGNINRTLTQLQAATAKATDAPTGEDDLVAALKQAEEVAETFPEIAGPLVKTLKVLQSRLTTPATAATQPPAAPAPASEPPTQSPAAAPAVDIESVRLAVQQEMAVKAIDELHPDRHQLKETPEFKKWFSAKPPEYQQRVLTTWNPAALSRCFDQFKAWREAQKRKQERLEAAATPQGGGGTPAPSTTSDEQAAWEGYNAKPRAF